MNRLMQWLDDLQMRVSCRKFARHVSSEEPIPGGVSMRFLFWVHWAVCPFCRRYWDEVKAIGQIQRAMSSLAHHPAIKISEVKMRLKEKLLSRAS